LAIQSHFRNPRLGGHDIDGPYVGAIRDDVALAFPANICCTEICAAASNGRSWPPVAREAALTVRPASASGEPTTPAPDYPFEIEFTGWSRVEANLDFGAQPGELLAALLLMQDRGDDGGFAAAIPALAYLRSYEFLERRRESYGDD
jgi:hypothetical protein